MRAAPPAMSLLTGDQASRSNGARRAGRAHGEPTPGRGEPSAGKVSRRDPETANECLGLEGVDDDAMAFVLLGIGEVHAAPEVRC